MKQLRKHTTVLIALVLVVSPIVSQDFSAIDEQAKKVPATVSRNVASLAEHLNKNTSNNLEKVRAYYIWITHNINYDVKTFFSGNPNPKTKAIDALKRKLAICQGYSELFKELCQTSDIPCELIAGYSKGYGFNPNKKLNNSDHAWNVVFVENKWQLVDATWGSGYVDGKKRFVKKYFEEYFLADPKVFILKHLPTDPMWQLLPCPINIDDYLKSDEEITALVNKQGKVCFNFNDTISTYLKLSNVEQQVASAERSFRFNPENYEVTGYAYLNLAYELSQGIQVLYNEKKYEEALVKNNEILRINKKAYSYLVKSKSDQGKNAAKICKQNMDSMKKNIKSLEGILK